MTKRVTGLFSKPQEAVIALNELSDAFFSEQQVSVLMSDQTIGSSFNIEKYNKAGEGFTVGASLTGLAGAIAAGLTSAGVIAIPGLNLVAVGPAVAAFAGAGAGAAAGGSLGGIIGSTVPEYEAKIYEDGIKNGSVLIAVDVDNNQQKRRAEEILEANNAQKIAA
ncbi:hypothetical protein N9W34_03485 [Rickettsiales bacterium]|nr:hypothetical protein [Rickettsiales bacterium]